MPRPLALHVLNVLNVPNRKHLNFEAHLSSSQSLASPVHMKNLDKFIKKTGLKFDALMIGINRMPEPKGGDVKRIEVASDLSLYMCSKECSVWGTVRMSSTVLESSCATHKSQIPRSQTIPPQARCARQT
jgi:hypothetical protein